ncbi:MAG: hypothetical protein A3C30_00130 [Candidatus Levybacteria bacterium RIFCSPHIGHO2_02_FULL_40_18]|nr:MAG: hypothetical protein A2869_03825 [Candidatus Levybacteria bacterium RIFCSPHIGHO2_01_FULL_40_58]OGH27111.1 MAG: hypothetical protein A3C30_00130 [Candidatus Levybacteria bacterium RIFCSPHIGHO2_02_FULL_40_18]OGH30970.1 MAG: hypothetical protein A3E43_04545 [Candidatus Levybacteria bacterium RIFCSPHIGHO2_12_FULL_40_31]OGH40981.1 MAG: hypothetical protein A2894_01760 [Candidatus Levybacteria bacterium RIFCSPLOWO2_01_FULL_40_64]OGH48942.1 MAG: hypothetical protein A3I54_02795 [Candidatus Lev
MESRLSRRSETQNKKQLYASLIGIVIIIFVALNFGPILISRLGSFIDILADKSKQTTILPSDADLEPPQLDPLPAGTTEELINVKGSAFYTDGAVELFLNDSSYEIVNLDNSQDFEIRDVKLEEGENILKVRMIKNNKGSEFSQDYKISYLKGEPKLEIGFPSDGASFTKADQEINVSGTTDPDNTVKVNDFIAIVDTNGNFSYFLKLKEGENKIKIVATNPAGKTSEKEITVSYSP